MTETVVNPPGLLTEADMAQAERVYRKVMDHIDQAVRPPGWTDADMQQAERLYRQACPGCGIRHGERHVAGCAWVENVQKELNQHISAGEWLTLPPAPPRFVLPPYSVVINAKTKLGEVEHVVTFKTNEEMQAYLITRKIIA